MSRKEWLSSLTILLVEDNKINQFLAQKLIAKTGPNVLTADNGLNALEILDKEKIDVVLTDIQMPGMTGLELAAKIKNSQRSDISSIPIIAITGYTGDDELKSAELAGINHYISKPFGPDELITILERVLNKNQN